MHTQKKKSCHRLKIYVSIFNIKQKKKKNKKYLTYLSDEMAAEVEKSQMDLDKRSHVQIFW